MTAVAPAHASDASKACIMQPLWPEGSAGRPSCRRTTNANRATRLGLAKQSMNSSARTWDPEGNRHDVSRHRCLRHVTGRGLCSGLCRALLLLDGSGHRLSWPGASGCDCLLRVGCWPCCNCACGFLGSAVGVGCVSWGARLGRRSRGWGRGARLRGGCRCRFRRRRRRGGGFGCRCGRGGGFGCGRRAWGWGVVLRGGQACRQEPPACQEQAAQLPSPCSLHASCTCASSRCKPPQAAHAQQGQNASNQTLTEAGVSVPAGSFCGCCCTLH